MNTPKCYSIWVNVGYEEREDTTMHLLEEEQMTSLLDITKLLTCSKSGCVWTAKLQLKSLEQVSMALY